MKYIIRSVKYFLYFCILLTLFILILVAFNLLEGDIDAIFKDGYGSILKIAVFLAVISAAYPSLGFIRRQVLFTGDAGENRKAIRIFMEDKGYCIERDDIDCTSFRIRSAVKKATRMWEDRITFTYNISGAEIEGLRKDVASLVLGLERVLRNGEED